MATDTAARGARALPRLLVVLLLLLLPFPSLAEDAPPAPPPAPRPRDPVQEFQARVDAAIDRGIAWLRRNQAADGSFSLDAAANEQSAIWMGGSWSVGANALAVYTLAACDVPLDDPALMRGFDRIRADWSSRGKPTEEERAKRLRGDGRTTYFVSLCLMALDAAHNRAAGPVGKGPPGGRRPATLGEEDAAWAWRMVWWLNETQDDGSRNGHDPVEPPRRKRLLRRRPVATGDMPSTDEGGCWGYGLYNHDGYHDHSNSQFAFLGLKAGARLGVEVPRETWIRGLRHFLAAQERKGPEVARVDAAGAGDPFGKKREGEVVSVAVSREKDEARGWGYVCGREAESGDMAHEEWVRMAYGSMTAGGVSSLVIARSELEEGPGYGPGLRALTEKGIRDGLAWLALSWKEIENPGPARLKGPSRPMSRLEDYYFLYGLERACILGGVSRIGDADWYRAGAEEILGSQRKDGSFQGFGVYGILPDTCFALLFLKRAIFRVPDRRVATEPGSTETDEVDSLLKEYRAADGAGRPGVLARCVALGTGVLPKLILRLGDDDHRTRYAAHEVLRALTGRDFGYSADSSAEGREEAVEAWETWWMANRERLVPDSAGARFLER